MVRSFNYRRRALCVVSEASLGKAIMQRPWCRATAGYLQRVKDLPQIRASGHDLHPWSPRYLLCLANPPADEPTKTLTGYVFECTICHPTPRRSRKSLPGTLRREQQTNRYARSWPRPRFKLCKTVLASHRQGDAVRTPKLDCETWLVRRMCRSWYIIPQAMIFRVILDVAA